MSPESCPRNPRNPCVIPPVARAICLVRHGRAVAAGRRKVRGSNPVRAGLAVDAAEWPWSSARSHLTDRDDRLVRAAPMLAMVADWRAAQRRTRRRRTPRPAQPRPHGLPAGGRHVSGTPGAGRRSCPTSPKAWSPVQITQASIISSCPRNPPGIRPRESLVARPNYSNVHN